MAADADLPSGQRAFEHVMATVLRWGVLIAVALFAFGLLLSALDGFATLRDWDYTNLLHPSTAAESGSDVLLAGLVVLVLTPVVRVATATAVFAGRRDPTYVGITLLVLAVLAATVLAGVYG